MEEKNDEKGKSFGDLMMSLFYVVLLCAVSYAIYFFADEKYNMQKTVKAIDLITKNMRATFEEDNLYPSASVIRTYPITPSNMENKKETEYYWRHYFGGTMLISGTNTTGSQKISQYNVIFNSLSKRKCKLMATFDWRRYPNFLGLTAQGYSILARSAGTVVPDTAKLFTSVEAEKMCDCSSGDYCSVILVFK